MGQQLNIYKLGTGGVQLTKDPLHLADEELTQAQNAEIVQDVTIGGEGALTKRGGLAALNASAMTGSIIGLFGWPIKTTYTRTLYAGKGTHNSNTFMTTLDGSSWTDTPTPTADAPDANFADENNKRDARRIASYRNLLVYPGTYTKSTDQPPVIVWDGTNTLTTVSIQAGPSGNGSVPFAITDSLVANGKIYMAIHDQGGSGANIAGRVVSLDLTSGVVSQIAAGFGPSDTAGGQPSCLLWYQNQLFVGLNGSASTDGIGTIVRCYPDLDTAWTTDVSNLSGHISSLCIFNGDVYAGTQSSVSSAAKIYKRSATAATYSVVFTSSHAGENGYCGNLIVYNSTIYGTEYSAAGDSDVAILKIKKSADGSSWSTDRDVAASDSGTTGNLPAASTLFGSDLFISWRATTAGGTDGFIMRLSSGSWTKAVTDNFNGPLAVLVQRSS